MKITLEQALPFVRELETKLIPLGAHCALGGSVLHQGESRKDLDIFVYPRNCEAPRTPDELVEFLKRYSRKDTKRRTKAIRTTGDAGCCFKKVSAKSRCSSFCTSRLLSLRSWAADNNPMILRRDRCHWCGTETFASAKVGPTHPKCSTVDHVRSKPECRSYSEYFHYENRVNACYACNQKRSTEWVRKMNAGLVHPTEWSIKEAQREAIIRQEKKERREAREQRRQYLANCKPCRVIHVPVSSELEEAYRNAGL